MKAYPTIPKNVVRDHQIYTFDKLDGSQIRAEWTRKNGFYKFGSRKVLIDNTHPLGEAVKLIQNKYGDDLSRVFCKKRLDQTLCFFEFFGPNSFAGQHENEDHDVVLFDVNIHKKGILDPPDYLKLVGHLEIAKLLYTGRAGKEFEMSVKDGTLEGMTFEGVVCKGKHPKKTPMPLMFKIKSEAWLQKLREFCAGDETKFHQLA